MKYKISSSVFMIIISSYLLWINISRETDTQDKKHEPKKSELTEGTKFKKKDDTLNTTYDSAYSLHEYKMNQYMEKLFDIPYKKKMRQEISQLKPIDYTLVYLSKYYDINTDEKARLHIGSIISQVNPSGYESLVKDLASKTDNSTLFIDYIYSLKNSNSVEAKKAFIRLIKDNSLPITDNSLQINKQGVGAIQFVLLDIIISTDHVWLNEIMDNESLTDSQINIITNVVSRYSSDEMFNILQKSKSLVQSDAIKEKIEVRENKMKDSIKYRELKEERRKQMSE